MKKILITLSSLLLLTCFLSSCDDEMPTPPTPEPEPRYHELQVITGIDLFDANGSPIGRWKTPNDKPGDASVFPNPGIDLVALYSPQPLIHVWLIPTDCVLDSITADIPALSQDLFYEIDDLEAVQIKDIPLTGANNQINLDLSDVPKGFYKVFFQIESEELFWQNIYVDPSAADIPSFEELDGACL